MNATEIQTAAAEVISAMIANVNDLENALVIAKMQRAPGFVFVWPQYWLGAKVTYDQCRAVGVHQATITHKADKRVFTNGKGEKAVLMNVREALEGALAHAVKVHADFAERASKTA
jgi:hypothetical protein